MEGEAAWLRRRRFKWFVLWGFVFFFDSSCWSFLRSFSVFLGQMEPEVKFHSIGIISDDFGEITTPLPIDKNQNGHVLFTLKEGSRFQLKLTFNVMHNIVSGLTYSNTVWKAGLQGADTFSFASKF